MKKLDLKGQSCVAAVLKAASLPLLRQIQLLHYFATGEKVREMSFFN
jgi:hypothetical protein